LALVFAGLAHAEEPLPLPLPAPVSAPLPPGPPPGVGLEVDADCFARAEVALVFPHLASFLTAPVVLEPGRPATVVALHSVPLNPTVAPLFEIGAFRFGPGWPELAISYRFLAAEGTAMADPIDASGPVRARSRLNLQGFDFDWIQRGCPLVWGALLEWRAG